jgi:DNA-directed RNA polymerase subunit K/omega
MRSDDVFAAAKNIGNRFLLCRVASVSARQLQEGPKQFTESINRSFKLIAAMPAAPDEKSAGESPITFVLPSAKSGADVSSPLGLPPGFSRAIEKVTAR